MVYSGGSLSGMAVCKSENAGASWGTRKALTSPNGRCLDIAVAPCNSNVVYAVGHEGYTSLVTGRIFRSDNAGNNWTNVTNNLSSLHQGSWYIYAVAVHSTNSQKVFAGTTQGLFVSHNGGVIWQATELTTTVMDLVYDPSTRFLFAGTSGEGVQYSEDDGISWKPLNNGLSYLYIQRLDLDKAGGVLYLSSYRRGISKLPLLGLKTGVRGNWDLYE